MIFRIVFKFVRDHPLLALLAVGCSGAVTYLIIRLRSSPTDAPAPTPEPSPVSSSNSFDLSRVTFSDHNAPAQPNPIFNPTDEELENMWREEVQRPGGDVV
ncbi:uncharacterized protein LOC128985900 [Macrosteles quadrilineatus]|uniref:uncharacterized protein LOC128985900 n=1 Tax=Macrosteles quadrilineatus TaxID=74068 RepID=UPI0023E0E284|nr:uncharacterized protein LOC128985900 [Macrosteles quadrilineatus]